MLTRCKLTGVAAALLLLAGCENDGSSPNTPSAPVAPGSASTTVTTTTGGTTTKTTDNPDNPPPPKLLALERAIGQRLITGYRGARPTASVLNAVRAGRVGGVILFGENVPTLKAARRAIRSLKQAAAAGHQPALLIMVDQEGGDVKRLASLPPNLSPKEMGTARGPQAKAKAEGLRTGRALRKLGVNVDLAPVADVPDGPSSFLGSRAFAGTPKIVAYGACGFAAGLAEGGVAGSLKHFPGLGRAKGNTDLVPVAVTAAKSALDADLAAYRRCAKDVPMVMVSSASYPALGIKAPAVLSSRSYALLRTLGFRGITISDAFVTPAIANQTRPARTALKAGVDLLLYGPDEAGAQRAYTRLLGDARAGDLHATALRKSAARILAFKRTLTAHPGRAAR